MKHICINSEKKICNTPASDQQPAGILSPYSKLLSVVGSVFFILVFSHCGLAQERNSPMTGNPLTEYSYPDTPFIQEYHEGYGLAGPEGSNEIRSIAAGADSMIWVATTSGVFRMKDGTGTWQKMINGDDSGPSYDVCSLENGDVLLGTWNGVYRYHNGTIVREQGPVPPVSAICSGGSYIYALGPNGIWQSRSGVWEKTGYRIARSVRDAICDSAGCLWVGTDAGLYSCRDGRVRIFQDRKELISCYVRGVAFDHSGNLWAGVLGGVTVRKDNAPVKNITPGEGIPSVNVNCVSVAPDGTVWVGTDVGAVRFFRDGTHSLRFSRRWLTDDRVLDITFDSHGNAWIGTGNGVSAIKRRSLNLEGKANEFYRELMRKHIREPWICGVLRLDVPGDTTTWRNTDDDNDGEYTGGYLAMESFRYASTGDTDALIKARKAFRFLRFLQEVTGTSGFFARSVVPSDWKTVNDPNRGYDARQIADALVADPRYKPVAIRWRISADGKWLWKGDTSSDEMDGHIMGYFFFYLLAAKESDKAEIRDHVRKIMDCLISTGYELQDIDGTHTRWSVWSPEKLNNDPDWASERSLNSFELLAYLKFTAWITGDAKYEKEYRRLIDKEGYLENASRLNSKNPAWQVYFDRTLEGYLFPILLKCEKDPVLHDFYRKLADEWIGNQQGENLVNNFTYAFATGVHVYTGESLSFLRDTPMDLVDWPVDHTKREDIRIVRHPILEDLQIETLPPASERSTVRWDKNPWAAVQGDAGQVREPVFWLWPYWMARYLGVIKSADKL